MWEECDLVEDVRYKKKAALFNKKRIKIIAAFMSFLICLALFFSTAYIYANEQIAKAQAEELAEKIKAGNKGDSTLKTYEIERKLLDQLKKKNALTPE
jgi:hypothetical protein